MYIFLVLPSIFNDLLNCYFRLPNKSFCIQEKVFTQISRLCGLLVSVTYSMKSLATLRATSLLFLMHSGIVNRYQLLCDADIVLEPHRGTAVFSILLTIVLVHFFFLCFCHSDSPISFLGCLFSLC